MVFVRGRPSVRSGRVESAGSHRSMSTRSITARGMFTRKMDVQPKKAISTPPSTGPIVVVTSAAMEIAERTAGGVLFSSRPDWSAMEAMAAG